MKHPQTENGHISEKEQIAAFFKAAEPGPLAGMYSTRIRRLFDAWHDQTPLTKLNSEEYMDADRRVYERVFGDKYLFHIRVHPYTPTGGDGYGEIDKVFLRNDESEMPRGCYIFKKAITGGSMATDLHETALAHQKKLAAIRSLGIATPHMYAIEGATLYEEFIHDKKNKALEAVHRESDGWEKILGELVRIAHAIDRSNFSTPQLLSDLLYDGERFVFVDGGQDIAEDANPEKTEMLQCLCRNWQLGRHSDWIRERYAKLDRAEKEKRAA